MTTEEDQRRSGPSESVSRHDIKEQCSVLIDTFWEKKIAQPANVNEENLREQLSKLQEDVIFELERLRPLLQFHGLMGYLVACCRRRMAAHLQSILQRVSSSRCYFQLMHWARNEHVSYKYFSGLERQMVQEWDEWETQTKDKLLQSVQEEIKRNLENILQYHKIQTACDTEEDYVATHVDVLQCILTVPELAKSIDEELSNEMLQVCSQELLTFVQGYSERQREVLIEEAKQTQPQTIHFLKTLKTCGEIKRHMQGFENTKETVEMLEEMIAFSKDLLAEFVIKDVEQKLEQYFKLDNTQTFPFATVEELFPCLPFVVDEHEAVMDDIYKAIVHIYFKYLIGTSRKKLKKWSANIGTTVHWDAEQLHRIISARASDVHNYSILLLRVEDVITLSNNHNNIDAVKLIMAVTQQECRRQSEDLQLLPNLLLWKGLSKREVREVMNALPVQMPKRPKSRFWSFMSFFFACRCWCRCRCRG